MKEGEKSIFSIDEVTIDYLRYNVSAWKQIHKDRGLEGHKVIFPIKTILIGDKVVWAFDWEAAKESMNISIDERLIKGEKVFD